MSSGSVNRVFVFDLVHTLICNSSADDNYIVDLLRRLKQDNNEILVWTSAASVPHQLHDLVDRIYSKGFDRSPFEDDMVDKEVIYVDDEEILLKAATRISNSKGINLTTYKAEDIKLLERYL